MHAFDTTKVVLKLKQSLYLAVEVFAFKDMTKYNNFSCA
jgi:hypothetical protein